jgi:hypothetical protein
MEAAKAWIGVVELKEKKKGKAIPEIGRGGP